MPLGASRLNAIARYIVSGAPPAGSWANWTISDVGTVQETSFPTNNLDTRGGVLFLLDDNTLVSAVCSNATPSTIKLDEYALSGNTITYNETVTDENGSGFVLNQSYGISFPTYNQGFFIHNRNTTDYFYRIVTYDSASPRLSNALSMTNTSGVVNGNWQVACQDHNDEKIWASSDLNGIMRSFEFDPATETVSMTGFHSISNCATNSAHAHLIENSGVAQIAVVYVDSVDNNWKVYQADVDGLTNGTTTSLGVSTSTFNPGHGSASHATYQVPCSKLLMAGIWITSTDNLPLWTVNWDDSTNTWSTDATTTTFNLSPDANFEALAFTRSPRCHVGDNVWAFIVAYRNNTDSFKYLHVLHMFELSSTSTITELGSVDLNPTPPTSGVSNPDDKGIVMNAARDKLYVLHDDGEHGQYRSVAMVYRPTS